MIARRRALARREETIARHRAELADLTATPEREAHHRERVDATRRALARELSAYEEALLVDSAGLAVA